MCANALNNNRCSTQRKTKQNKTKWADSKLGYLRFTRLWKSIYEIIVNRRGVRVGLSLLQLWHAWTEAWALYCYTTFSGRHVQRSVCFSRFFTPYRLPEPITHNLRYSSSKAIDSMRNAHAVNYFFTHTHGQFMFRGLNIMIQNCDF